MSQAEPEGMHKKVLETISRIELFVHDDGGELHVRFESMKYFGEKYPAGLFEAWQRHAEGLEGLVVTWAEKVLGLANGELVFSAPVYTHHTFGNFISGELTWHLAGHEPTPWAALRVQLAFGWDYHQLPQQRFDVYAMVFDSPPMSGGDYVTDIATGKVLDARLSDAAKETALLVSQARCVTPPCDTARFRPFRWKDDCMPGDGGPAFKSGAVLAQRPTATE